MREVRVGGLHPRTAYERGDLAAVIRRVYDDMRDDVGERARPRLALRVDVRHGTRKAARRQRFEQLVPGLRRNRESFLAVVEPQRRPHGDGWSLAGDAVQPQQVRGGDVRQEGASALPCRIVARIRARIGTLGALSLEPRLPFAQRRQHLGIGPVVVGESSPVVRHEQGRHASLFHRFTYGQWRQPVSQQ
jgi:hypothetical protein